MVGQHHGLSGHEFEETVGDSEGQGSLACCSSWSCKKLDMTEQLNNKSPNSENVQPLFKQNIFNILTHMLNHLLLSHRSLRCIQSFSFFCFIWIIFITVSSLIFPFGMSNPCSVLLVFCLGKVNEIFATSSWPEVGLLKKVFLHQFV